MNSQDSPQSILVGFSAPMGGSATPGGNALRTQRSLLAELLAAAYASGEALDEEYEEEEDELPPVARPPLVGRTAWCSCNVGQAVPVCYHARECALLHTAGMETLGANSEQSASLTSPITIPNTTYFKHQAQIEERARFQYTRQYVRAQLEHREQLRQQALQQ